MALYKADHVPTQLVQVIDRWSEIIDEGGNIDNIYLDFAKAFDSVPHLRLIVKLQSYGIGGKVLDWINNFLTDRRQRVLVQGSESKWTRVLTLEWGATGFCAGTSTVRVLYK